MNQYDEIISLGTQCNPGLTLRQLNIKKETYPFDWVRSNSKIIYDVLLNGREKYILFNNESSDEYFTKKLDGGDVFFKNFPQSHINSYGQFFTHYTNISTDKLIEKLNRWFDRFYSLLKSDKRILFIHTHEEYIYHKLTRDNKDNFYEYLCKINDILEKEYPTLKFTILNIDIDNKCENYKNIINMNMEYNMQISDNCETHVHTYFQPYRDTVTKIIQKYLY